MKRLATIYQGEDGKVWAVGNPHVHVYDIIVNVGGDRAKHVIFIAPSKLAKMQKEEVNRK